MFNRNKDNKRTEDSNSANASTNTNSRPVQTNVTTVPFRFPWIRRGKVVNKQYTDMEVSYDRSNSR